MRSASASESEAANDTSDATTEPLPVVELRELGVRWRSRGEGQLRAEDIAGRLTAGEAELGARRVVLDDGARFLEADGARLEAERPAGEPWSVRRLVVGTANAVLGPNPRLGWSALVASLDPRRAADAVGTEPAPLATPEPGDAPDEPAVPPPGAPPAEPAAPSAEPNAPPAAPEADRPSNESDPGDAETDRPAQQAGEPPGAAPAGGAEDTGSPETEPDAEDPASPDPELAEDARSLLAAALAGPLHAELASLTVRAMPDETPLLDGLRAELDLENGVVETEALGRLAGGTLEWDLALELAAERVEGRFHVDALPLNLIEPLLPDLPLHRADAARFGADVHIDRASDGELTFEGTLQLRRGAIDDPAIAPVPVRDLDVGWRGAATWSPEHRRLAVDDSTLTVRGVETRWRAEIALPDDGWSARVRATLPPTRCNDAARAVPEDLLQDAAGFRWSGTIGAQVRFSARSDALDATVLDVDVANGCVFDTVPAMADLRRVQGPFVHRVQEPDGTLFEMSAGPGTANWAPLHATSPFLVHAVIGHEDAAFLRHEGFSVGSIRDALVRNLEAGVYVRGGSTISQQLAKNVFLHREKTLARKAQELLLTWWLESALPKEEILALYLNVIEYGPGIYGIVNAADHYFGRHPSELTAAESAYLACILPNPKGFHDQWVAGQPTPRMRRRVTRFLRVLHDRGRIDAAALADGEAQIQRLRFRRPDQAPSSWPQVGRTRAFPFATAIVGDPFEAFLAPAGPGDDAPAPSLDLIEPI